MSGRLRSFITDAWPFVGALYLLYLALQAPPVRYVGIGGLVIVTPLLFGWTIGHLFGVGPWGESDTAPPEEGAESDTPEKGAESDTPEEPEADG